MKYLFFIFVLTLSSLAFSQNEKFWDHSMKTVGGDLLLAKQVTSPPTELIQQYRLKDYNIYSIDLNSDGKLDFIVEHKLQEKTCFIDSGLKKKNCEDFSIAVPDRTSRFMLFAQLDDSPMLELFDFITDDDYSDYKLKTFDEKTWKLKPLLIVHPLVESTSAKGKNTNWGAAINIEALNLKKDKDAVRILATFENKFSACDVCEVDPSIPPNRPALLFDGSPRKSEKVGKYNLVRKKMKWMTLKELLKN